jgi:hypothetical protein
MRYLVKAKIKPGRERALWNALEDGTLGRGSIAGEEYRYDLEQARVAEDGTAHWVETCFCAIPLQEERPYWEEYFELLSVRDAHNRKNCRDWNGTEPWACSNCDCTKRLEQRLRERGEPFLAKLKEARQSQILSRPSGQSAIG